MKFSNIESNGHIYEYTHKPTYCDNCEQFMWTLARSCIVRCKSIILIIFKFYFK